MRSRFLYLSLLLAVLATCRMAGAEPRRVLLLHSFGRDFAPFSMFSGSFRTELLSRMSEPVDLFEASLESARFNDSSQEGPFVDYLRALFAGRRLDLVVSIGGPAARFAQRHREQLFPGTPTLITAADQRHLQPTALTASDAVVAVRHEPVRMLETLLQLLPQTTNVAVVIGTSPLEQFWFSEFQVEFRSVTNRLGFQWLNRLSFPEMLKHCAALPPHSAIYYALLSVDAEGVPHLEERALTQLHDSASAPIFGLFDTQLGRGIVGGPLIAVEDLSRQAAEVAVRILRGENPSALKVPAQAPGTPRFDWRELERWGISEQRLPPGSTILFRQPTVWEQHQARILTIISLCLAEATLILLLVANLVRRRRAEASLRKTEEAARDLSGRLITAQEGERARLARELHDDITQRLARLAIDIGRYELGTSSVPPLETARQVREGLVQLSEDVHALSYRLHPSVLEDLGLVAALKVESERFTRRESIPVTLNLDELPTPMPGGTALCLFRVAQEALRNVARHAQARAVTVSLRKLDGGLELAVQDDGVGFDPALGRDRPSLGLASMRERVHLLAGELDVDSAPGRGTTIVAWVPLKGGLPSPR